VDQVVADVRQVVGAERKDAWHASQDRDRRASPRVPRGAG
jgi:hypothetical protein